MNPMVRQEQLALPLLPPSSSEDLHVCEGCLTDLVHPTEWSRIGRDAWAVELRCPNCWQHTFGVFTQEEVDRLERALDADEDQIVDALRRAEGARITDEVEAFAAALDAGALLPEDF